MTAAKHADAILRAAGFPPLEVCAEDDAQEAAILAAVQAAMDDARAEAIAAATEKQARFQRRLDSRDHFIVGRGLWDDYVDTLHTIAKGTKP